MIVLDPRLHRALARHGGPAVRRPLEGARAIGEHRTIYGGCGIYVACDVRDRVQYVGSVHRPGDSGGISRRIAEHLREPGKALRWERLWVLVVDESVDRVWVRTFEGIVGAELAPSWNDRLPTLRAG